MSQAGMVVARGSRATLRRATRTKQANGSFDLTWATQALEVPVLIAPISAQKAQMLFGRETKIATLGTFLTDAAVREDDGLWILSGFQSGSSYRVVQRVEAQFGMQRGDGALAFGLELAKTTEFD